MESRGPVFVSVVGASGAGKTTLVEGLISELCKRGYKVATVKHAHGGYELDKEGSDSFRHAAAGASGVLLVGPREYAAIWPDVKLCDRDAPSVAAKLFAHADVILVEGYSALQGPKIFVHRRGVAIKEPAAPQEVICAVADEECGFEPRFRPEEYGAVADFILEKVMKG